MFSETVSLEDAQAYIYSIDFSQIIDKMVRHQGWLRKDALTVCKMYRNFLYLNKKYGSEHKLPPSEDVDEFWHLHILDTKKYKKDCQAVFGKYLDHYPYFGIDGDTNFRDVENAFDGMQKLHVKEFGEEVYQVRNIYSRIAAFFKGKFSSKPRKTASLTTE